MQFIIFKEPLKLCLLCLAMYTLYTITQTELWSTQTCLLIYLFYYIILAYKAWSCYPEFTCVCFFCQYWHGVHWKSIFPKKNLFTVLVSTWAQKLAFSHHRAYTREMLWLCVQNVWDCPAIGCHNDKVKQHGSKSIVWSLFSMWCNVMQYGAIWCNMIWCNMMKYDAIWCNMMQ